MTFYSILIWVGMYLLCGLIVNLVWAWVSPMEYISNDAPTHFALTLLLWGVLFIVLVAIGPYKVTKKIAARRQQQLNAKSDAEVKVQTTPNGNTFLHIEVS